MRPHRRVAPKSVVVAPVAELIASIPPAFGATPAQHPPAPAGAASAASSEPPAAASEPSGAAIKQSTAAGQPTTAASEQLAAPRRRRSLSQDADKSWSARLGAAAAQLAGLRLGRTRSEPGKEAALAAGGASGSTSPNRQQPGAAPAAAAAAAPTSQAASPLLFKPAHPPPRQAAAASGEQPGSPGSPGKRRLQRSMRHRPHVGPGGRPPRPPPQLPVKAAAAGVAVAAEGAAGELPATSASPPAVPQPAAQLLVADEPAPTAPAAPEAAAEGAAIQPACSAVPSAGAPAPLSTMPRKLQLELLALMRRQRDYVGLRQQAHQRHMERLARRLGKLEAAWRDLLARPTAGAEQRRQRLQRRRLALQRRRSLGDAERQQPEAEQVTPSAQRARRRSMPPLVPPARPADEWQVEPTLRLGEHTLRPDGGAVQVIESPRRPASPAPEFPQQRWTPPATPHLCMAAQQHQKHEQWQQQPHRHLHEPPPTAPAGHAVPTGASPPLPQTATLPAGRQLSPALERLKIAQRYSPVPARRRTIGGAGDAAAGAAAAAAGLHISGSSVAGVPRDSIEGSPGSGALAALKLRRRATMTDQLMGGSESRPASALG